MKARYRPGWQWSSPVGNADEWEREVDECWRRYSKQSDDGADSPLTSVPTAALTLTRLQITSCHANVNQAIKQALNKRQWTGSHTCTDKKFQNFPELSKIYPGPPRSPPMFKYKDKLQFLIVHTEHNPMHKVKKCCANAPFHVVCL